MPSWKKVIVSGSSAAIPSITHTGDFTLDVSGDITLDGDGADIILKDGGTEFGRFKRDSSDFILKSMGNDNDIVFRGRDGGSTITALTLDMSSGGDAQFRQDVIAYHSSDERLKDNVTYIHKPIDKINKIGGYKFTWNNKQETYLGKDIGVLAQEVEAIMPELVTTRENGYKAVKYDKLVPLLIEGIKELDKKVKDIEKNCDCLKK